MKTVIIDYELDGRQSIIDALLSLNLDHEILVSNRPEILKTATHLILPNIGDFNSYMQGLKSIEGLSGSLHRQVMIEKKPLLGICSGMHVLASKYHKDGESAGLGFIDGKVAKTEIIENSTIVDICEGELLIRCEQASHPVLKGLESGDRIFLSAGYHFSCQNEGNVLAQADCGFKVNAIIAKKNIIGIQFCPENSGAVGLQILKNFLNWRF